MIIKYIAIGAVSLMLLGCGGGGSSSSTTPETPENSVIINEVLASNKTIIADPQYDKYSDWIELYNTSDSDVNLGGYGLSDSAKGASWFFPQGTTIQAKNYLLVWADDKNSTTSLHTDFKLSKSGDKVVLYAVDGTLLERLDFKEQYSDVSYARDDNAKYVKTLVPTPKRRNEIFEALESEKPTASLKNGVYATEQEVILSATPGAKIYYELDGDDVSTLSDVYTTPLKIHTYTELRAASLELEQGKMLSSELSKTYVIAKNIRINEILADNNSSNVDEDGDYGDWIELYNDSASYVRLDGYGLSDSKKGFTWKFPPNTAMQARSYLLVWADDKNNSTHTDFKLSAKDDKVVLFDELGVVIDLVEFKDQHQDYSYAKDANKTFQETSFVTPLAVNVIAKVDKADFSPDGGVFSSSINVLLSTPNSAPVYYTTDGKSATRESKLYTSPIYVSGFMEINAIAQAAQDDKRLSKNKNEYYAINHGIYLNEVLAKNDTINKDPDFDEYGDWIEIYNSTDSAINIGGYGLSTSKKDASWNFPKDTILEPQAYLLVWADNKDITKKAHHTDFKLSANEDELVLFNSNGLIIDFLKFKNQEADRSLSRNTRVQPWDAYSSIPTPGE